MLDPVLLSSVTAALVILMTILLVLVWRKVNVLAQSNADQIKSKRSIINAIHSTLFKCQTFPILIIRGISMSSIESNVRNNEFWQNHIAQWQLSGLSQANYCRQHNLAIHQLSYWKGKLLASQPLPTKSPSGFTRVQISDLATPPTSSGLSLCFRDGTQLLGMTEATLPLIRQLVEILR